MFELPKLEYSYSDLEPYIDSRTMEIHYSKHHAAYINNLNSALETLKDIKTRSIEEILTKLDAVPEELRTAVKNNGGGHYNHCMFWTTLSKKGGGKPSGSLEDAIEKEFDGFDGFKDTFTKVATGRFGSGWAWLFVNKEGSLRVSSTPNQDNPLMEGNKPILGLDVWEHAYYLKYQNKRVDYISNWWDIINWTKVEENYSKVV